LLNVIHLETVSHHEDVWDIFGNLRSECDTAKIKDNSLQVFNLSDANCELFYKKLIYKKVDIPAVTVFIILVKRQEFLWRVSSPRVIVEIGDYPFL